MNDITVFSLNETLQKWMYKKSLGSRFENGNFLETVNFFSSIVEVVMLVAPVFERVLQYRWYYLCVVFATDLRFSFERKSWFVASFHKEHQLVQFSLDGRNELWKNQCVHKLYSTMKYFYNDNWNLNKTKILTKKLSMSSLFFLEKKTTGILRSFWYHFLEGKTSFQFW